MQKIHFLLQNLRTMIKTIKYAIKIMMRFTLQIIRDIDGIFTWATTWWQPKEPLYGNCKQRGICCQNIAVGVSKKVSKLPPVLHIINAWYSFVYNFNLKGWYENDQIFIYSCRYLKDGKCSIYWRRPLICRDYPRSKRIGQTTMPGCGYSLQPKSKF